MQFQNKFSMESPPGPRVALDGKEFLYFCGTGYYCLQGHPGLLGTARSAMMTYGISTATGSGIPVGNSPVIKRLEKKAADFFGTDAVATFPSGYMSSAIGISSLKDQYDHIFMDETTHFAGLDSVRLVDKPVTLFKHLDPDDLKEKIKTNLKNEEIPLVVSDGIFPTFGNIAPCDKYAKILEPHKGLMWLDDAHAVGVIGPQGRGTYDWFGICSDRFYFGGTFSKAFGGYGGFIPGSEDFVKHIKNTSTMITGSNRIDLPCAAASWFGLDFLMKNPVMKEILAENSQYLKDGIKKLGILIPDTPQPVATFVLDSPERMTRVHNGLLQKGIAIQFTTYVGGPKDGALRIVVFSEHTKEQIQILLDTLAELIST